MFIYLLMLAPFLLLAFWASSRVKGLFAKYSRVPLRSGVSGAEAAAMILRAAGIEDVKIERAPGLLADHYDPTRKIVRLSDEVLTGRSVASVAVAAHEVGHAIQHAQAYGPMTARDALVPVVNIVAQTVMPMFVIGLFLHMPYLAIAGCVLYGVATLFHLVTLPVEFDASNRAIRILEGSGIVLPDEMVGVRKTLYAAGFTYIAATLVALVQLVYFLLRSGALGGKD